MHTNADPGNEGEAVRPEPEWARRMRAKGYVVHPATRDHLPLPAATFTFADGPDAGTETERQ